MKGEARFPEKKKELAVRQGYLACQPATILLELCLSLHVSFLILEWYVWLLALSYPEELLSPEITTTSNNLHSRYKNVKYKYDKNIIEIWKRLNQRDS